MNPQSPAVSPIREMSLAKLNDQITRIRQRLDNSDRRSVENPATTDQIAALQAQISRLQTATTTTTTVNQAIVQGSGRSFAFFSS